MEDSPSGNFLGDRRVVRGYARGKLTACEWPSVSQAYEYLSVSAILHAALVFDRLESAATSRDETAHWRRSANWRLVRAQSLAKGLADHQHEVLHGHWGNETSMQHP